jgi:hypothetical protein
VPDVWDVLEIYNKKGKNNQKGSLANYESSYAENGET